MIRHLAAIPVLAALASACGSPSNTPAVAEAPAATDPMLQQIQTMAARFAPVDLTADANALPANERQALAKMIEAARVFDALYLRQVWEGNESLLVQLSQEDRKSTRLNSSH